MILAKPYTLEVRINLENAQPSQVGKAIGMLCREHVCPRQIHCVIQQMNDTCISTQTKNALEKLLGLPSPWEQLKEEAQANAKIIVLDDRKVNMLAKRWNRLEKLDLIIVVPHIYYLPLLVCFIRSLEILSPELLPKLHLFFSYSVHVQATAPDIISRSFFGERAAVLRYVRQMGLTYTDLGHQLYVENQISLASYMIPAQHLVFMDDDFFIDSLGAIETLTNPLKQGYTISGMYAKPMEKIHTCFFAFAPEYLRDNLRLFDDGKNLYLEKLRDTGAITYQELASKENGVCIVDENTDGNGILGRHLGHCAAELWFDFPIIFKKLYRIEMIPEEALPAKVTASTLLESVALIHGINDTGSKYELMDQDFRINAINDFAGYFAKLYNNHRWLERQAKSPNPRQF